VQIWRAGDGRTCRGRRERRGQLPGERRERVYATAGGDQRRGPILRLPLRDGHADRIGRPVRTRYAASVSDHPISGKAERYLSVGLDSTLSVDEFERPRLDLVAVLDVSGRWTAPLTRTTTTNTGASARPRTTRLRTRRGDPVAVCAHRATPRRGPLGRRPLQPPRPRRETAP